LVASISNSTTVSLEFLGFTGDVAAATTIPVGAQIVPGPGNLVSGVVSSSNAAYAVVQSIVTLPAPGSNVTVTVNSTTGFVDGQNVYIATQSASGSNFTVYSINSATSVTLKFLNLTGDVTTTLPANSLMVPGIGNQSSVGGIPTVFLIGGIPTFTAGIASTKSNGVAPVSISFPATTVAWTNANAFNIELYILTSTITVVKKNGTTIFSGSAGNIQAVTLHLQPGETFSATYATGSPSATYSPM
jgi:hypothetical protein